MGIEKIVGNIEKSDAGWDNHGCRDSLGDTILAKKHPAFLDAPPKCRVELFG